MTTNDRERRIVFGTDETITFEDSLRLAAEQDAERKAMAAELVAVRAALHAVGVDADALRYENECLRMDLESRDVAGPTTLETYMRLAERHAADLAELGRYREALQAAETENERLRTYIRSVEDVLAETGTTIEELTGVGWASSVKLQESLREALQALYDETEMLQVAVIRRRPLDEARVAAGRLLQPEGEQ